MDNKVDISRIKVLDADNRSYSDNDIIQSIGTEGVLVPLLVYKDGMHYVLIAGHRRLASAQHFGLTEVPVTVLDKSQETVARALENIDRKQLHPLDEADQIRKLQSAGWTNNQISATLGIGLDRLRRRVKLNNLSKLRLSQFRKGKITAEQAEELAVFPAETQDKVRIDNWMQAKDLRSSLVAANGITLSECTDEFLKFAPFCSMCPENTVVGEEGLFPGLNGSCKNPQCYAKKLVALMKEMGAKGVVTPRDEIKDLVPAAQGDFWRFTTQVIEGSDKFISNNGAPLYYQTWASDKPKTPKDEKLSEISQKYDNEFERFEKNRPAFFKECAKAYVEKNYRGIPMTSKSDIVRLAEFVLDEASYRLRRVMDIDSTDEMDNQLKVGIALMLIFCEDIENLHCEPSPGRLHEKCEQVIAPEYMNLPDILSLRKIKALTKLQDSMTKLQQIADEYNGVFDGTDD